MTAIAGLLAHARDTPAAERGSLAAALRPSLPDGAVLLETCHRVELFGTPEQVDLVAAAAALAGTRPLSRLEDDDLARHVIALAVGRSSTVLAEDQVLHQLRVAVSEARGRGGVAPALDRLFDLALRAGRRARTWAPPRRPSVADLAVDEGLRIGKARPGAILVVGAGQMGVLAARAVLARGRQVIVTSRSAERADRLAASFGTTAVAFDSAGDEAAPAGVVVALRGPWPVRPAAVERLIASGAWVVDLSAPPAVDPVVAARLGDRHVSVDDLARRASVVGSSALVARLDRHVGETLERYRRWVALEPERSAARALATRADEARVEELSALWQRIPSLDPSQRLEVERMAERLTTRLLRDPLERLRGDEEGRHRDAARELFGL